MKLPAPSFFSPDDSLTFCSCYYCQLFLKLFNLKQRSHDIIIINNVQNSSFPLKLAIVEYSYKVLVNYIHISFSLNAKKYLILLYNLWSIALDIEYILTFSLLEFKSSSSQLVGHNPQRGCGELTGRSWSLGGVNNAQITGYLPVLILR